MIKETLMQNFLATRTEFDKIKTENAQGDFQKKVTIMKILLRKIG